MKNKGYAKCWGQIRCIMGDVQVANKTEIFGQESTLGWGGGGSYKTSLFSSWVKTISASFTKIFKKLFSNVQSGNSRILDYTVNSLSTLFVRSA